MPRHRPIRPVVKAASSAKLGTTVDSEAMKRSEAYLGRGRCHEQSPTDTLKLLWIEAFKRHIGDFSNSVLAQAHEDIQAELRLRGEEPPFAAVEKEAEAFVDAVRQAVERAKRNPEQFATASRDLANAMDELTKDRKPTRH
jgi:hypothetical protein